MTVNVPQSPVQSSLTAEVYTGNPATVNDAYNASATFPWPNGQRQALGTALYTIDATTGSVLKWRYVRLNSTTTTTLIVGPVYYKDNTRGIVTIQSSESLMSYNGIAGFLMNTGATNGNFVFILVSGHAGAVAAPASSAVGDQCVGGSGAQVLVRVAAGTAPTYNVVALIETAVAAGVSDMRVCVEDSGW
jgi:hypothetical protein